MDIKRVDAVGQAAVNAAIGELGDDAPGCVVVVIVRPTRVGSAMNVTSNLAGTGNHAAVAAVLADGQRAVAKGSTRIVERVERRIVLPS